MITSLKFRRGYKSDIPILNVGEGAFTLDTKEFFIGDGNTNYNFTPVGTNLLTNGNFQIAADHGEVFSIANPSLTLGAGLTQYFFGNFYFSNTGTGNMFLTAPLGGSGQLSLTGTNAIPTIEYRTKFGNGSGGRLLPLDGSTLCLSFTANNQTGSAITYQAGTPSNLITSTLATGTSTNYVTFTYNATTLSGNSYPSRNFVLFKTITALANSGLSIGNFKVECSNRPTPFYANSIDSDIAALRQSVEIIKGCAKATVITENDITFYYDTGQYYWYDNPKITGLNTFVVSLNGTYYSDFVTTYSYDATYSVTKIVCTKNAHGLTDASCLFKFIVDNRP